MANILFSFGYKETAPGAALRAASQIDLITLLGLFDIMLEMISGCVQLRKYLIVLLNLEFFLLGAISPPFYRETGK